MQKIPLLPNIITALGLSCGLFVIFRLTMGDQGESDYQRLASSVALLLLAALADLLDGFVARATKGESDFGGVFDSLADAISFGVAPAVIVLKTAPTFPGTHFAYLLMISAMVFSVCGVLRLVRFSVAITHEKGNQEAIEASKKNFTGLPIPAACVAASSFNLLFVSPDIQPWLEGAAEGRIFSVSGALLLLGYLMVSRWKFMSFKALHFRVASFQVVLLTAVGAVFLFYGLLQHFALTLFVLSWAYVLAALTFSLVRYFAGKRVQTLEDFEPDPEDFP